MKLHFSLITLVALVMLIPETRASAFVQWQSTNVQLLRGDHYKVGDSQRTIVTLEHANRWRFGNIYSFVDFSQFDDGAENIYAEFTPRLSLSELTGKALNFGIVSDVFLSSQLEKGENGLARYMLGVGANVSLPGFSFFKVNLFNRNNPDREDTTWQLYLAWKYPLTIAETDTVIEGFADFFGEEGGDTVPHQLFVPRFLVDIGPLFSMPKNQLHLGFEWQYWHNKFGIEGISESVPQIQIKWTF